MRGSLVAISAVCIAVIIVFWVCEARFRFELSALLLILALIVAYIAATGGLK